MTNREATVKQALEALDRADKISGYANNKEVRKALRQVLTKAISDSINTMSDDQLKTLVLDGMLELAEQKSAKQEPVMILPDGSAFGVMSFPLPDDHWLYVPNEYKDGEYEPIDLPKPILTHALRDAVVAAVRYAVRGATVRGQETDFDPDALVQNAVYALCGPYTTPQSAQPAQQKPVPWSAYESLTHDMTTIAARQVPRGVPIAEYAQHALADAELREHDAPAQRKPLTDEQISDMWCEVSNTDFVTRDTHVFARTVEAAHGIKDEA